MQCETCPNITGFKYRGRILCSSCIDKIVRADNETRYAQVMEQRRIDREKKAVKDCEICGKAASAVIGFSDLCESCAKDVESCEHQNLEAEETLEDNYLVTRYLCQDCGVRFQKG